jgi:hypothetical protein
MRLKQRLIELPPALDIVEFVRFDGKPPADVQELSAESREMTLTGFRDRYLATHRDSLEDRTIKGIELHFKHLTAALGEAFPIRELKLADLQGYVDRRAKAKDMNGKRLSPATIRKEIVTLRTAWNWAEKMGIVTAAFPITVCVTPGAQRSHRFAPSRKSSGELRQEEFQPTKRKNNGRASICGRPKSRNSWPMPRSTPPVRGFSRLYAWQPTPGPGGAN